MEILGGKYQIVRKIGSGSFGEIYSAVNIETNEEVGIKFEHEDSDHPQLHHESHILSNLQGGKGIPKLHWYGHSDDFRVMVMELLGPSLENLLHRNKPNLSLKTVLMLANQMISRIKWVHSKNYIHRDIKPDNFLIGLGANAHLVYIIDYGLSKRYRDSYTLKHIPYRENKELTGTARYASIFTHLGIEQSRREDLKGLFYVLIYLIKGSLPWQGLGGKTKKEKYGNIAQKKLQTKVTDLCADLPIEFVNYIKYCDRLLFEDKPDYSMLKRSFKDLLKRLDMTLDYVYDWCLIKNEEEEKKKTRQDSPDIIEESKEPKPKSIEKQESNLTPGPVASPIDEVAN